MVLLTKISIPDRVYREQMDSSKGVLMIYLMDYSLIFSKNKEKEVRDYAIENNSEDFSTPLLGYALGFPTVNEVQGENFVAQHVYKHPSYMDRDELVQLCGDRGFIIPNMDDLSEDELKEIVVNDYWNE